MATLASILDELVAANRILAGLGVLDGFGHVSARHPDRADRYLLARSLAPELVTRDDVYGVLVPGVDDHLTGEVVDCQAAAARRGDGLIRLRRLRLARRGRLRKRDGECESCENHEPSVPP